MADKEILIKIQVGEPKPEKPAKIDKGELVDLDEGAYPGLHLQGTELPFTEEDVGKAIQITYKMIKPHIRK